MKTLMTIMGERGYARVLDYLRAHEGKTYAQLVADLPYAQIALMRQAQCEATTATDIVWFIRDGLAREVLQNCPSGWRVGKRGEFKAAKATSFWLSMVSKPMGGQWAALSHRIIEDLGECAPVGWLPKSGSDPVIVEVFRRSGLVDEVLES